jgi:hypothetical protein
MAIRMAETLGAWRFARLSNSGQPAVLSAAVSIREMLGVTREHRHIATRQ